MPTQPSLTESDIRDVVDSGSWSRGRGYFSSGRLIHPQRQGDTLRGECVGSAPRPYRVEATVNQHGIQHNRCSCPLGGSCKHVVALLLTYVHQPEAFVETATLAEALAERSREELIALIGQIVEQHPEAERLISLPRPGQQVSGQRISEAEMRQQVSQALPADYDYDYHGYGVDLRQVENLVALGDQYRDAGDAINAATIYRAIALQVLDEYEMLGDEEGEVSYVVGDCLTGLGDCLAALGDEETEDDEGVEDDEDDEDETRRVILHTLFDVYKWDINFGGIGMADGAPALLIEHATPTEKAQVAEWVREEIGASSGDDFSKNWRRKSWGNLLLNLERDAISDERFLEICRETGCTNDLIDKLLQMGRADEAEREAGQLSDYDLWRVANLFVQHDQDERIVRLLQERARRSDDSRITKWLKNYAVEHEEWAVALDWQKQLFQKRPSLDIYQQLRHSAKQLGEWEQTREQVMRQLDKEQQYAALIEIYLDEENVDNALRTVRQASETKAPGRVHFLGYGLNHLKLKVAAAAADSHPREAINLYLGAAKQQIAQRQRKHYAIAADHLRTIQRICQQHDEEARWQEIIQRVRSEHSNLPALRDELNKAGL